MRKIHETRVALIAAMTAIAGLVTGQSAYAQVSDGVVKIGVLTDIGGVYGDLSGKGSVEAARIAAEEFGNKVLGKPVEVIFADHQNKPDVGATIARRWYDEDKVDVILDVATSSVALAVQFVAKERNKPVIFSTGATDALTNKDCSPMGIAYTYDSYSLGKVIGTAVVKDGGDSWFFITADYAGGIGMEKSVKDVVLANHGTIVGGVRAPFPTADFSSYLLQAQQSKAKVIALANAGTDTINAIKQSKDFGIVAGGQEVVAVLLFLTDVDALGLDAAQGLLMSTSFYWDQNDEARAWSKKFGTRMGGRMPTDVQAGVGSAAGTYLRAVQATGTDDGPTVVKWMKEHPVNDFFVKNGHIRPDGRMEKDMYLAKVKKPSESKGRWDYLKIVRTVPGNEAFRPLSQSECPLVKH
jgi:branched-chain amino acid transport system substrate-binding protein